MVSSVLEILGLKCLLYTQLNLSRTLEVKSRLDRDFQVIHPLTIVLEVEEKAQEMTSKRRLNLEGH